MVPRSGGAGQKFGYVCGSKRAAFLAAYVLLGFNDHDLDAEETEIVLTIERIADGRMSQPKLADWIRAHLRPIG